MVRLRKRRSVCNSPKPSEFVSGLKDIQKLGLAGSNEKAAEEKSNIDVPKVGILDGMAWKDYCSVKRMNGSTLVHGCKSMKALRRVHKTGYDHPTKAMQLGSGCHCLVLEPNEFESRYAVMPSYQFDEENVTAKGEKSTSSGTKYVKSKVKEFIANNSKEVIEQSVFDQAIEMLKAIRSHHEAKRVLAECSRREVTLFGEIEGMLFKGRVDLLGVSTWCDLKGTSSNVPKMFGTVFARLRYAFKMSIYRELIRQNGLPLRANAACIIAQEFSGDFDTAVIPVPDVILDNAFTDVKAKIKRYQKALRDECFPGVDDGKPFVELDLPFWAMSDDEDLDFGEIDE